MNEEIRWRPATHARDSARKSWSRPAVAHHEAGHAVVARFLGHEVRFATIRPDSTSLGRTRTSSIARAIAARNRGDGEQRALLRGKALLDGVRIGWAGPVAEWRLTGRWNLVGARR